MNPDVVEFGKMRVSPLYFISRVWKMIPQPVYPDFEERYSAGLLTKGDEWRKFCADVKQEWFVQYVEKKHITWQQSLVLYGIEKALRGEIPTRISIVSGHGTGKSCTLSWIILWFLFVHPMSRVGCTAPSADQMYDVLWSELKKWIDKMPPQMGALYEWQTTHVRMREAPNEWWARAKTASKENTEALAGVHAPWVLIAGDEASGIDEKIFETMEGALTSGKILIFLISNGTRNEGYFYDTHHKDKARWQTYSFNSLQSPIVKQSFIDDIINKYGNDSVQYAIRVLGQFPAIGMMDDKGYVQLFSESDIHIVPFDNDWKPVGRVIAALDAAGEGQNSSAWAVRDRQRAAIVAEEQVSTAGGMAVHSMTLIEKYGVKYEDFIIDAFGSGHAVAQEIALATARLPVPWRVRPINSGEACDDDVDKNQYINKRAEGYYKLLKWFRQGGEIMASERLKEELLSIRFRRSGNGRIQIMSKVDMKRLGYPSPDKADALSYTMLATENWFSDEEMQVIEDTRHDKLSTVRDSAGVV